MGNCCSRDHSKAEHPSYPPLPKHPLQKGKGTEGPRIQRTQSLEGSESDHPKKNGFMVKTSTVEEGTAEDLKKTLHTVKNLKSYKPEFVPWGTWNGTESSDFCGPTFDRIRKNERFKVKSFDRDLGRPTAGKGGNGKDGGSGGRSK